MTTAAGEGQLLVDQRGRCLKPAGVLAIEVGERWLPRLIACSAAQPGVLRHAASFLLASHPARQLDEQAIVLVQVSSGNASLPRSSSTMIAKGWNCRVSRVPAASTHHERSPDDHRPKPGAVVGVVHRQLAATISGPMLTGVSGVSTMTAAQQAIRVGRHGTERQYAQASFRPAPSAAAHRQ